MNIWDTFVREKNEKIVDGSTGDVALDSYHQYKQDVQMLKAIGVWFLSERFFINKSKLVSHGSVYL